MPMTDFKQVMDKVRTLPPATLVLAAAAEPNSLSAVSQALREGILQQAVLVGDQARIASASAGLGLPADRVSIIHEPDDAKAARLSVGLVREGKAGILMKGLIHTAEFLRSVLSREEGLRSQGRLLSHVYVLEVPLQKRFVLVTDSAFNIAPDVEAKAAIASNAAFVARCLGIERPKVAAVAAVEVVNSKMPATLDAAELARRSKAGAFPDFILEGPFGLDNAVSPAAAALKGVRGEVAGQADILLVPDIETGNIFCKGFAFLSGGVLAGVLAGAKAPVVLCSRADSDKAKLYSIALAHLMAESATGAK